MNTQKKQAKREKFKVWNNWVSDVMTRKNDDESEEEYQDEYKLYGVSERDFA